MDGRYDLRRVADVVDRADADVVALQEVNRHRKEKTGYDDQVARYEERLGVNARYGVVLEEEPTEATGGEPRQMGQLVLSRHPIESSEVHHLPSDQEKQPRAVVRTRIDADGTSLRFDTAHLGIKHEERVRQAEELLELTDDAPNRVLAGDFNAAADSQPIMTLKDEFQEAFAVRGKEPAKTHPSPYVEETKGDKYLKTYRPRTQSDYVFASDDVTVENAEIRHSLASDHSPVLADLALS